MVHTQGSANTRRSVGTARVLLFKGGCLCWPPRGAKQAEARGGLAVHTQGGAYTRWCTHNAVHTQGSANTRRSVGTARVLSFKGGGVWVGPRVKRSEVKQGEVWQSTHTRRCIHKVVHTQGGAHTRRSVATAGVLLFKGGCLCWPPRGAKRAEARGGLAVHTQGGAYTRWRTHKAVQTQGALWAPQEFCHLKGGGCGWAPVSSEAR